MKLLKICLIVLSAGLLFLWLVTPTVLKSKKYSALATKVYYAKQLHLALFEFEQDHGMFPGDATAVGELAAFRGDHSNDYLGQLIAAGYYEDSGKCQFVSNSSSHLGIAPGSGKFEAGECGFSYIKNQKIDYDDGSTSRPLLLASMTGEGTKFDPKAYRGRSVVLRIDGSVKQLRIDPSGEAVLKNKSLFDSGEDTIWGERGFDSASLVHPMPCRPDWVQRARGWWKWFGLLAVFLAFALICWWQRRGKSEKKSTKSE
ncbi:hypothetical protein HW115_14495 [Verrucomicrobiaceae bacterium N1E253]|uniref:Uncharacterized protein n=1 Tax=Oceaniferula marina TaxID=2748318 RepID=A0A851GI05_9BACT|nr:hypothetical protein [Oceaniferula marina]NWK56829.1 hypothetical protein [Oceaniferula marina]